MSRDENIPVTTKQYLFLWLLELSIGDINTSGYVTDISQLDGYNLQIEEGSTATPYVPYGYLPMYKGRYKVSDVCQLLDKSKYPATQTVNRVTFTNNSDGSITVNGTATADTSFMQTSTINNEGGHKLLFIGCPNGGSNNTYSISYGGGYKEFGNGLIVTPNATNRFVYITIYNGND